MFGPILRGLSTFVFVVGFLAGCTGTFALFFRDDPARFAVLMALCLAAVIGALKMREAAGEVNLVGFTADELVGHFEMALALGLGTHTDGGKSAAAGAAAALAIVLAVAAAGWIGVRNLVPALLLMGAFGGLLALVKRRALRRNDFVVKNGRRYGAHRRLSVLFVPAITVAWLVLSAPEADPVVLALIGGGLLWWTGAAFFHVWELLHTTLLALMYGEADPRTVRWGLIEWLEHTRADARIADVSYGPDGEVTLRGAFDNPDELRRDLLRLNFVKRVILLPEEAGGSVSAGGSRPAVRKV